MSAPVGPTPETVGRIAMVIVAALLAGMLTFACVATLLAGEPAANAPEILSSLGLAGAGLTLLLRMVVPTAMEKQVTSNLAIQSVSTDPRQILAGMYLTKTIIGAALLEGAGFFNLVVYLIMRSPWNLGAAGVMATVMAVTFPSQSQFDAWADRTLRDRA